MGSLDGYDGLPHIYMPDDVHIVLSGAALDLLIAACVKAKRDGHGIAPGPVVDGEARAIILTRLEPLDSARSEWLPDPRPIRVGTPLPIVPRPEPERVPQLEGVLPDYG